MYLFYLDGSADHSYYTFSAIGIPEKNWREVFEQIRGFREMLREKRGIHPQKELHAWKFLSGRGRPSDSFLSLEERARIFNAALRKLASFEPLGVKVINSAIANENWAFERALNRINTCMRKIDQKALLIIDEGKEGHFIRLCRRIRAHNPIPSKYGQWRDGSPWKNIPAENIVEDPIFKNSEGSHLIQFADFCAFALLRMDKPTERMKKIGVHESFRLLAPVCVKEANPNDEFGVAR